MRWPPCSTTSCLMDAEHRTGRVRPAWIEVDLDAVTHNVGRLAALVAPAAVCAVVKANGYAHGAPPVAHAALAGGATLLAVALVEEGGELRQAGIDAPVLLLSEPPAGTFDEVVACELRPTLYTVEAIEAAGRAASAAGRVLPVHLKVNTGMNRVGAAPDVLADLAVAVARHPNLELEGIWTHLATADEPTRVETTDQIDRFHRAVESVLDAGVEIPLLHAANSAAALAFPEARLDLVRPGIAIYGIAPAPGLGDQLDLRPAMSVRARVSFTKRVGAGERISYGLRHRFARATNVATVPIGYADGVPRRLSGRAEVLVGGIRRRIVGTITMDQLMVDCGDDAVAVGDDVVLLGEQGDERVDAWEWAELLDTIAYEVVCGFGPRLPREA